MKYFIFLFGIPLLLLFSSCNESPQQDSSGPIKEKVDTAKIIFLTQQTELRAAEYFTADIKIPVAVCKKCEKNITKLLKELNGVIEVKANAHKKIVKVKFDGAKTTIDLIRQVISKAGYDADNVKADESAYKKLDDCCKI